MTEYSSMKFAWFFLAEYINMINVSAIATTLFLGGWRAPVPLSLIGDGMLNNGWWPLLWFLAKIWIFMFLFVWIRGSLLRLRYDQFMRFGWKILIPAALVWIVAVAGVQGVRRLHRRRPAHDALRARAGSLSSGWSSPSSSPRRSRSPMRDRRPSTPSPAATPCHRCLARRFPSRRAAAAAEAARP